MAKTKVITDRFGVDVARLGALQVVGGWAEHTDGIDGPQRRDTATGMPLWTAPGRLIGATATFGLIVPSPSTPTMAGTVRARPGAELALSVSTATSGERSGSVRVRVAQADMLQPGTAGWDDVSTGDGIPVRFLADQVTAHALDRRPTRFGDQVETVAGSRDAWKVTVAARAVFSRADGETFDRLSDMAIYVPADSVSVAPGQPLQAIDLVALPVLTADKRVRLRLEARELVPATTVATVRPPAPAPKPAKTDPAPADTSA